MLANLRIYLSTVSACVILLNPASAQAIQSSLFASGFSQPVGVEAAPGDTARVFVVEQTGKIRVVRNGAVQPVPFLNLGSTASGGTNKVSLGGERGLLGLAFHPQYAQNGHFFVNYTNKPAGSTVIARYSVSANPDVADPASELVLLTIGQPASFHNGGCVRFGPDGMLYVGMGDGGPSNTAQSPNSLLGKMLRLDVDLPAPHIPPDNPHFGPGAPLDEIWHSGLRNPWRFSFDRVTGELYVGDVGESSFEEIDVVPGGTAGANFGWDCNEGQSCTGLTSCTCNAPSLTAPLHTYSLAGGVNCAVIGGFAYRGASICGLQGTYFFTDYCSAAIWSFRLQGGQVTSLTNRQSELAPIGGQSVVLISAFGEDAEGELYFCDYSDGEIFRIEPAGPLVDCNSNGIRDACEILAGTALDCNSNGVPDECDVSSGASRDLNANGVPDECECAGAPLPAAYCTAKTNSAGCVPLVSSTGLPRLQGGAPFTVRCDQLINNRAGLMFYGYQRAAQSFQGGTMCVAIPVRRTPIVSTAGAPTGLDCSGAIAVDVAALLATSSDPLLLQVGQVVDVQFWSRDPQASFGTNLSDALEFHICP